MSSNAKEFFTGKKPRGNKMDPRQVHEGGESRPKTEKDWGFNEILRSKSRRRGWESAAFSAVVGKLFYG